eukprot:CAMPEP_0113329434 /NCGR_PEP_ID=MMETSP0010_2-20120614/20906_1 /TAXON_ID=216773 ORGANISM="Corethron hystrix, Strain 308" /NCGR_SAMPLE_ID=MMETSP0010_2 /ASSEMBLY_ACC=CAM_ASM_000155 /LENGTH=383 /DNA_ID=CAMNT_0000191539 /DNA_START=1 /DNA_END=1151 /DNA_ORIENTATION=+ /assembly_acc=CAM_ASM_000155
MGPNVGAWKQCVYEKKPSNFLGCYADAADRALPVLKGSSKSVDQCSDLCDGYKYFARQWKGECWCGNDSYSKHGPSTGCDCMGPNVGAWKQCVYEKNSTGSCKSVSRVNTAEPNRGRTGPGFKILNDTPFPIEVSIGQTGPLYWELIQPGKWMYRETGAVWFTLKAYTRFDGKAQIDHWAAVVPVLVIVGSVAAAIATAGSSTAISASVAAGGAAGSVSGAAVVAVAQVLVAAGLKAGTAKQLAAAAATGAVITSTGVTMAVKEAVMDDIGLKEDHVYASDAGVYAGYPWPFEQKTQAIRVTGGHPGFEAGTTEKGEFMPLMPACMLDTHGHLNKKTQAIRVTGGHPGFEAGTTEKGECVTVFDKSKLTNLKFECISGSCFVG